MSRRISEAVLLQKYEERNQELYKENIKLRKALELIMILSNDHAMIRVAHKALNPE